MDKEIVWTGYISHFKDKLYGLLCEYEKQGKWEEFLDNLLIELEGFDETRKETINYLKLHHKMSILRYLKYDYFRKTIFDCMELLSKIK